MTADDIVELIEAPIREKSREWKVDYLEAAMRDGMFPGDDFWSSKWRDATDELLTIWCTQASLRACLQVAKGGRVPPRMSDLNM